MQHNSSLMLPNQINKVLLLSLLLNTFNVPKGIVIILGIKNAMLMTQMYKMVNSRLYIKVDSTYDCL